LLPSLTPASPSLHASLPRPFPYPQIAELQKAAEARLNSLSPPLLAEYRALTAECKTLNGTVGGLQAELERINTQVEAAEAAVKRDRNRDEYAILEKRVRPPACLV
jgi:predicted  nucleic acid-binding Zn-ribbon protein